MINKNRFCKFYLVSMINKLIKSTIVSLGIEKYSIDLDLLYPNPKDREQFEKRWIDFYNSDLSNKDIMLNDGKILTYYSESVIPTVENDRPSLLFVFGNPAPHSIKAGIPFAYEGNNREHRIWSVLKKTSLIDFHKPHSDVNLGDLNLLRKHQLHNLEYDSKYKVGFIQYFSMPSTPSKAPWTGVNGLFRLFRKPAMKLIEETELIRIKKIVENFMPRDGTIVVFQKDAYNGLKSAQMPKYSADLIRNGKLTGNSIFGNKHKLICAPPTRLLYSKAMFNILNDLTS